MKVKSKIYFNNGDVMATPIPMKDLVRGFEYGPLDDKGVFVQDKRGRNNFVPLANIAYIEDCYNRYDQLHVHAHGGEKSELGVAADFVANTPYYWAFPETNFGQDVENWLFLHQRDIPADLQGLYMKIASTLLAYWYDTADAPEIDEAMKKMGKTADEIREKGLGDDTNHYEEPTKTEVKELIKFLRSKMPLIEREYHESEDKQ